MERFHSGALQGSVAIAALELRCIRRATRTWLLALLALAAGWTAFVFYHRAALQHFSLDHYSGNIVPGRFLMAGYAACFMMPLLAGLVLLTFDHRHRDQAAGIVETLDARPVSNVALFVGRLLALTAATWLVCALFAVAMQVVGLAADQWLRNDGLDGWLGPVEPWSLAAFLFIDAPSVLVFWIALVLLLAATLRNRLAVAVLSLALLSGYGWLLLHAPLRLLPAISAFSGFEGFASDMLPRFVTAETGLQRVLQLLLTVALVVFGAMSYPRADSASRTLLPIGALALALAATGIALAVQSATAARHQRATWLDAHLAHRGVPAADLVGLSATVAIEPGTALHVDASLAVVLPVDPVSELVFSLNPGMRVQHVWFGDQPAQHRHEDGLLRIPADGAQTGTNVTLRVVASGVPDPRFAYLDSDVDPLALGVADGHYRILGTEPMVFSEDYAVLLPGLAWLPTPGVNLQSDAPDFHDLELLLDVPAAWHGAAPGQRDAIEAPTERRRFRFRKDVAVPSVGVVAGRFERYAATVGGVEMELLLHPGHRRNAEFFAPEAQQLLNMYLGPGLARAKMRGVDYPHKRFSVVEVPGRLRGFGGGWQLDTALALPGIALLREYGLPSMRMTMRPIHMVSFFMPADFSGGDPTIALWRSIMRFQAAAAGEQATLLNFVMDEVAKGVLWGFWPSFFSAHHFDAAGSSGPAVETLNRMMGHGTAVDEELQAAAGRIAVSSEFLTNTLGQLRFADDAERALDMLNFKGRVLAQTLAHGWPSGGAAELLRETFRRHRGGTYTLDDLRSAGATAGAPLDAVLGEWWATADLPGFVTSPLQAYRLEDGTDGPRYQLRLHVCNTETAPGLVRLRCGGDKPMDSCSYSGFRVAADACVELGQVTDFLPMRARLDTYLSKNGNGITFPAPSVDADRRIDAAPVQGARDSAWRPPETADIVVDDLSAGFRLNDEAAPRGLRIGRRTLTWTRQEAAGSWGKHARTATWSDPGNGDRASIFAARLPTLGRWRLDYHLPGAELAELEGDVGMSIRQVGAIRELGEYEMTMVEHLDHSKNADETVSDGTDYPAGHDAGNGDKHTTIEFDGSIATEGWNHLGDFDLQSQHVSLVVTDRTNGEVVVADAIRWRPLE